MSKIILITGATDGIGLETAKRLADNNHILLLHGRNPDKLAATRDLISQSTADTTLYTYLADLSDMTEVLNLANQIKSDHAELDVLINNAGIFKTESPRTKSGLDIRFAVNTLAPYLLTKQLLPIMTSDGRVVNLSSAAQAAVNLDALAGRTRLNDMPAYAQSKLALTMWSRYMGQELAPSGPAIIAVNPGSLLASKMVKEGFGVAGSDLSIGADILYRAALSKEFARATGQYYDNDSKQFAPPAANGSDPKECAQIIAKMDHILSKLI